MRTKAFFWIKVSEEVCHQWLILYDARQIGNDPKSNNTGPENGPIKEERVSLRKEMYKNN